MLAVNHAAVASITRDGIAPFSRIEIPIAGDVMNPYMPFTVRVKLRPHRDTDKGMPSGKHTIFFDFVFFTAVTRMPSIPIFAQCQHIVEGTVLQQLLCFADAEPEQAGVNEFFILGFIMAVLMGTVACRESHHMALVIASGNQHAGMRLQGHLGGIRFRLFRLPEGMILRQCKAGKCLHGPVGRTGSVVSFCH